MFCAGEFRSFLSKGAEINVVFLIIIVIPAKAGIQGYTKIVGSRPWAPVCTGATGIENALRIAK